MKDLSDRTTLLVAFGYDGARFFGLQPQLDRPTAGAALIARLTEAFGTPPRGLAFAARTDRGVHATHNLATCWYRDLPAPDDGLAELARERDDGLRAVSAVRIPPQVHARGASRGKHYRYVVEDGCGPDSRSSDVAWRIVPIIDVKRAQGAARLLMGTHDFSSLRGGGCDAQSTEKTLSLVQVGRVEEQVVIDVVGNAFLRKMVRNLVGLLVEVGTGWREPADVATILAAKSRMAAGLCAPPEGLTLVQVGFAWPPDGSNELLTPPPASVPQGA